jgi:hypothetical protein
MNDTISKGNRIKIGRGAFGTVSYVSPGGMIWFHEDDTGHYRCAKLEKVERVHGLKGKHTQTKGAWPV